MIYWTDKDKNVQQMCLNHAENARAAKCPGQETCLSCMRLFRFLFKTARKFTNMLPTSTWQVLSTAGRENVR